MTASTEKSTVAEIRERFDNDVERFSNLDTGQSATMDAPLVLDLIASAASMANPAAASALDIGCGAGNYSLKLLERLPNIDVTLIDLSLPMLMRARQRIAAVSTGQTALMQGDIRDLALPAGAFDIIMAAMVLHHLRSRDEWRTVAAKLYASLKPGGSLWIADHVAHETPAIQSLLHSRWGAYLVDFKGTAYRDHVFSYVDKEDTPETLTYQLELLREVGFSRIDVLHKNALFAAFGAIK